MLGRRFGAFALFACLAGCAASVHGIRAPVATGSASSENAAQSGPASDDGDAPVAAPQSKTKPDDAEESESAEDNDEGAVDDGLEVEPPPNATIRPAHPFANLSDAELEHRLATDSASLGSMSVGKPNAGLLFNGVPMPEGAEWTVVVKGEAYGTEETIHYLTAAIHAVNVAFPGSPRLEIGDISAKSGGYLSPHLSHQAGRDVDISYFYLDGEHWYVRATEENLDVKRTWAFIRALITQTDVEMLLIDHSLQLLLRAEAEREGEDREWLDSVFRGNGAMPPLIRHAPGHATHLHIRFYSPIAQETGRRLYAALVRHQLVHVGPSYVAYVARKGDTLATLAKRYHTTVPVIRRANGLRSTLIQAKRSYRIPQPGHAPPGYVQGPVAIPPRRLPPEHSPAGNRNVTG
jgi:murein endopeptidase